MTIVSKDYGVLFKLLRAGRIRELTKLEEEVSPGHWLVELADGIWLLV